MTIHGRSSTRCACTPTPPARRTRATCATTPSATWPFATRPCWEKECSALLALTHSDFRQKTPPSRPGRIHEYSPKPASLSSSPPSSAWVPSTTGVGRSAATIPPTYVGPSSSSSGSGRRGSPTGPRRRSTGAPAARPCWPTSRFSPDGTCDRSGDLVYQRDLEQWFFRITAYADELLEALDDLEWPERVKTMQRHWIGRSEGAEFDLPIVGVEEASLRVFTTRPDTSFGMTYAVVAPEHPLVELLTTDAHREEVRGSARGRRPKPKSSGPRPGTRPRSTSAGHLRGAVC